MSLNDHSVQLLATLTLINNSMGNFFLSALHLFLSFLGYNKCHIYFHFFLRGGGGGKGGRDTEKKYYLTKFTGLQEHIEYVTYYTT